MYVGCKSCGYFFDDRDPGTYFCPDCGEDVKFYEFAFGCATNPLEIFDCLG